jgi:hypothetical protein
MYLLSIRRRSVYILLREYDCLHIFLSILQVRRVKKTLTKYYRLLINVLGYTAIVFVLRNYLTVKLIITLPRS